MVFLPGRVKISRHKTFDFQTVFISIFQPVCDAPDQSEYFRYFANDVFFFLWKLLNSNRSYLSGLSFFWKNNFLITHGWVLRSKLIEIIRITETIEIYTHLLFLDAVLTFGFVIHIYFKNILAFYFIFLIFRLGFM